MQEATKGPSTLDRIAEALQEEGESWDAARQVEDDTGSTHPILSHRARRRAAWLQLIGRVPIPGRVTWNVWWRNISWNFLTIGLTYVYRWCLDGMLTLAVQMERLGGYLAPWESKSRRSLESCAYKVVQSMRLAYGRMGPR